jgi:hypothetical protein
LALAFLAVSNPSLKFWCHVAEFDTNAILRKYGKGGAGRLMPNHPEWVRTVVSSIAGLSSPTVFCDAGRFMDSAHQRRAEAKLKKGVGA